MEKMWENFRRFVENKEQLTLEDVETLAKLARMFRAGNLQQAFATADAVGLLDGFLDVLFYGTTNEIIDVLGGAEEAGELDEDDASEMFEVLDLGPGYASTQRKMRDFLGTPAAAQDEALMNKILDMTNETFNSKGVPGLTSGGWTGTFETKMIIAMIRNPAQSENILKRIVKLASEWKPAAGSAGVRRYLWNIITRLDSEHSGLKTNPNVTNAPEGPVARIGPGFREPNGHFSVGTKTINPEWVEWANS